MSRSWELRMQKQEKESQRRDYEERKTDVENLKYAVENSFYENIIYTNAAMEQLVWQQENGFVNFTPIQTVSSRIHDEREKDVYTDTYVAGIQEQLAADITDTENKINMLSSEIETLEAQIRQAEIEEEEARRRAREAEEARQRAIWESMFQQ